MADDVDDPEQMLGPAEARATRPVASDPAALRRMQRQRRSGTGPELRLRKALWRQGLRYRVDAPLAPLGVRRRADLLFTGARIAVFVDGCFWHSCPEHGTRPKANAPWWNDKLDTNIKRDRDTDARLREAGWLPVRVWEHQDMSEAAHRIAPLIRERQRSRTPTNRVDLSPL